MHVANVKFCITTATLIITMVTLHLLHRSFHEGCRQKHSWDYSHGSQWAKLVMYGEVIWVLGRVSTPHCARQFRLLSPHQYIHKYCILAFTLVIWPSSYILIECSLLIYSYQNHAQGHGPNLISHTKYINHWIVDFVKVPSIPSCITNAQKTYCVKN